MSRSPNIVLIVVHSLRADHLGAYGYRHATTPALDALAIRGVVGERLFCSSVSTLSSITTLYTGQHPVTHQILSDADLTSLDREAPFLVQSLLEAGYTTCAVNDLHRARPWFARGYEFLIDPSVRREPPGGVLCEEANRRAIAWLRDYQAETFFLFLHYGDLGQHPGAGVDAYDRNVHRVDDAVDELLRALQEIGQDENTLLMVVGDHGASLGERGQPAERSELYDCLLHVPLLVSWPGRLPALRLPHLLDTSDIAPTLLDAAGALVPDEMDGQSFWPLLIGQQAQAREYVVSVRQNDRTTWSLRTGSFKLIWERDAESNVPLRRELYDLAADPGERCNAAALEPDRARSMADQLEGWIAAALESRGD